MKNINALSLIIFYFLSFDAHSNERSDGMMNWRAGNYSESYRSFLKCALDGDTVCAFYLAGQYEKSQGVERDEIKAMKWYSKASEDGKDVLALSKMGEIFYFGKFGQKVSYEAAYRWYLKAAVAANTLHEYKCHANGGAQACYMLGWMREHGQGIDQDLKEAWEWYRLKQYGPSLYRMAVITEMGKIHKPDLRYALYLYEEAAKYGYKDAAKDALRVMQQLESKM